MSGSRWGRAGDLLLVVLLGVAVVQAALLVRRDGGTVRAYVPLLARGEAPGGLQAPGGAARALAAHAAAVGDFVTVEDLARGVLALRDGTLPGAPALTDAERTALDPLLRRASEDRLELLRVEGDIAKVDAAMQDRARAIAATLTPAQRAWVVANRDVVSVGQIEQSYWDELLAAPGAAVPEGAAAPAMAP
jgi:hypothetical protein